MSNSLHFNPEIEQAVIGGILREPRWADEVRLLGLRPEDFFRDEHETLLRALYAMADAETPITGLGLDDRLREMGELQEFIDGGMSRSMELIGECYEAAPHAASTGYFAQVVHAHAKARDLAVAASETIESVRAGREPADRLVAAAEARVAEIADRDAAKSVAPISAAVPEVMDRLRARDAGEVSGVPTGLPELDGLTDGLPDRTMIVLAARPSLGKTALALSICEYATFRLQVPSLFVSLEMGRAELAERLIVMRSEVFGHKLRKPHLLNPRDRDALARAADEVGTAGHFHVDDAPSRTMAEIAATARRYRTRKGVGLIVVDYMQLIDPGDAGRSGRDSRQEQVSKISRRLKALAGELDVPVLALSQLNREAEKRPDKRPQLADLRESGAVEQDADIVMLLHRPDFYDAADRPGEADLIVAKNRHGGTGMVRLRFTAGLARFEPYAPVDPAPEF